MVKVFFVKKKDKNLDKNTNKNIENLMKENINVENKNEEILIDEEKIIDTSKEK